jgi:uncharacterized protein DUF177 involved in 23S rRNA accumulation
VSDALPLIRAYELGRLSQTGAEVTVTASDDERAAIARWADVQAVTSFTAKVVLRKLSSTRFALDADLTADIVQSCVVTLDPVDSRIERRFSRELILVEALRQATKVVDIDLTPVDEDGREEIANLRYDLAVPLLEEFVLAIDPYPRAPGVAFEPPQDASDEAAHPFAALKNLKS